ncbi:hypothetical protein AC579_802 [Pseudocercospora musae]|uniref:Uncharacterized protein n=1 Tax=Pseudocercospora musae TaxID=113226 RepID=A0A139IHA2_9PEZI|nr:hypothetical protein AC579_802 [Pseudocercospora musae]
MTSASSRLTIEERITALPQELQDQILETTLIASIKLQNVVLITPNYKPPWQLSVNRATRRVVAEVYYGTFVFQVIVLNLGALRNRLATANRWLLSLPATQRFTISHFRLDRCRGAISSKSEFWKRLALHDNRRLFLSCYTLPLNSRCIEVDARLENSDGSVTTRWVNWDGAHALLEKKNASRDREAMDAA